MIKNCLIIFFYAFLLFPQLSFSFSEAEIDTLESSGKKSFSSSLWRTNVGFSLQRNLELRNRLASLFDTNKEASLFDVSNLYYNLSLNFNYSLSKVAKNSKYNFLKNTEIFLENSFNSPLTGHNNNLKNYNLASYIQYALGDVVLGFTVPTYQNKNFLSYFSFSFIAFPFSRFSREAGLSTTLDGTVSLLYFLKKVKKWNLAFSSRHNLAYSDYKKPSTDVKGIRYNIPLDTSQRASFIYSQNQIKYFPSNITIFASHYFGVNTKFTRNHDLTLGASSSWKLRERLYINFSVHWSDRIYVYNPYNENVEKKEPIRFNLIRTFFVLGGSYSF